MKRKGIFIITILATAASIGNSAAMSRTQLASANASSSSSFRAQSADQPKAIQIVAHKFTFEPNKVR